MEMGKRVVVVVVVMVAAAAIAMEGVRGVTLCNMSEDGLNACKPSVTQPTPVLPPSAECCKALSGADLKCLCSYRNSLLLPSLGIDPDLAMALPTHCQLTPPPDC